MQQDAKAINVRKPGVDSRHSDQLWRGRIAQPSDFERNSDNPGILTFALLFSLLLDWVISSLRRVAVRHGYFLNVG